MRWLSIDRFEGKYAICEDDKEQLFAIELTELPEGATAGDVLEISDDGTIFINTEETQLRKARILEKQKKLFNN